jgi:hypothetical protein
MNKQRHSVHFVSDAAYFLKVIRHFRTLSGSAPNTKAYRSLLNIDCSFNFLNHLRYYSLDWVAAQGKVGCFIYANFLGKMIFKAYELLVSYGENRFSGFTYPGSVIG